MSGFRPLERGDLGSGDCPCELGLVDEFAEPFLMGLAVSERDAVTGTIPFEGDRGM